jgi:hypothetical protein
MLPTYKAILNGNQVNWVDETPPVDQNVEVLITLLTQETSNEKQASKLNEQLAYCLEKIAEGGGITGIDDPVSWQKDLRQDRSLIDRE